MQHFNNAQCSIAFKRDLKYPNNKVVVQIGTLLVKSIITLYEEMSMTYLS